MTKNEFIAKFVEDLKENDITIGQKEADTLLKSFVNVVVSSVAKGEKVLIPGLGSFEPVFKNARTGFNPATQEKIDIPAKTVPKFKVANAFKNTVIEAN